MGYLVEDVFVHSNEYGDSILTYKDSRVVALCNTASGCYDVIRFPDCICIESIDRIKGRNESEQCFAVDNRYDGVASIKRSGTDFIIEMLDITFKCCSDKYDNFQNVVKACRNFSVKSCCFIRGVSRVDTCTNFKQVSLCAIYLGKTFFALIDSGKVKYTMLPKDWVPNSIKLWYDSCTCECIHYTIDVKCTLDIRRGYLLESEESVNGHETFVTKRMCNTVCCDRSTNDVIGLVNFVQQHGRIAGLGAASKFKLCKFGSVEIAEYLTNDGTKFVAWVVGTSLYILNLNKNLTSVIRSVSVEYDRAVIELSSEESDNKLVITSTCDLTIYGAGVPEYSVSKLSIDSLNNSMFERVRNVFEGVLF